MTDEVTILPDGSAFAVMSFPLPKDHWLYQADADGFTAPPPMPWRMGAGEARQAVADKIRAAARYAIQASTMRGQEEDFDPDAMVQNFVVGMLGYWTPDGLSSDGFANPAEVPPPFQGEVMSDITRDEERLVMKALEASSTPIDQWASVYPDPTPEMLNDPLFEAIWQAIKGWDISRLNNGIYSGPTGNDARHIFDAARAALSTRSLEVE